MGYFDSIKVSFMIVGHTKFSPDWCFGLLKQRLRRCTINCLDDMAREVKNSACVNSVQLVGTQTGDVIVKTYDWTSHLNSYFRPIVGLKKMHHFHFSARHRGVVKVQEFADSEMIDQNILVKPIDNQLPPIITPPGLSDERQLYLYE